MEELSWQWYLRCLEPWVKSQEKYLYTIPDRPDLICYGTGYNNWGVQTNQKAFAAFAVLAADPDFDEKRAGLSREKVLEYALKTLRFSLESHHEGSYRCTDGTKWGHTWISALGIERMMHGVEAIEEHLTAEDKELLRKVLISESDWLLDHYEIVASLYNSEGKNRPESNIWNGAVMLRTAAMYPDAPRADEYIEKGIRFLINGISLPEDEFSRKIVDGKAVADRFVGPNFFPSFALNHHGYLNVGYMVICLSNAAMLHFFYKKRGLKPPEALYHHLEELWALVKNCTFPDGRLLRIGGDTRVRYCYCQDYAIPSWLLLEDLTGDLDACAFETGWLRQIEQELAANKDGSFLSQRLAGMSRVSPLYYTRLEADRAVTISMGAYWRRLFSLPTEVPQASLPTFSWSDEYHGAAFQRGERRVASFVWEAAQPPQGLCLPAEASNLAEWRTNLAGQIMGLGTFNQQEVVSHQEKLFPGGFLTWGKTDFHSLRMSAEGQPGEITAHQQLVFAALPDDATTIVLQRAVNPERRTFLASSKGLFLQIPNDIFNGNQRTYYTEEGKIVLPGFGSSEELFDLRSSWLNVEDKLSVIGLYGADSLSIYRSGRRQVGLKPHWDCTRCDNSTTGGQLFADEICFPGKVDLHVLDPGEVIYDLAVVLQAGTSHEETKANLNKYARLSTHHPLLRALLVEGADGRSYLLMVNFASEKVTLNQLSLPDGKAVDLVTGKAVQLEGLDVLGEEVRLFRID
ncbi:MAG: hypothetical protein GX766_08920 [Firmicutes bacterium]|jgi:hypothetical protein|nr:hypothetical protein [Bacillota bacterium]HQD39939.1 hypothetical protein [Bacillota bacterium]